MLECFALSLAGMVELGFASLASISQLVALKSILSVDKCALRAFSAHVARRPIPGSGS